MSLPWQAPFWRMISRACNAADDIRRSLPCGAAVYLYYRPADPVTGAWGDVQAVCKSRGDPPAGYLPVRPERIPGDIAYGHLPDRWRDTFRRLPVIGADGKAPPELMPGVDRGPA